jgi:single-strand DNA-binding protein
MRPSTPAKLPFEIVVFRRQAENVNNYLSKGSLAGVDGRIQSRSYENQEGRP